jgi:hypothetical protein
MALPDCTNIQHAWLKLGIDGQQKCLEKYKYILDHLNGTAAGQQPLFRGNAKLSVSQRKLPRNRTHSIVRPSRPRSNLIYLILLSLSIAKARFVSCWRGSARNLSSHTNIPSPSTRDKGLAPCLAFKSPPALFHISCHIQAIVIDLWPYLRSR